VFGPDMAEYVIAQIIIQERNFFALRKAQEAKDWSPMSSYRKLSDLRIGLLGLGNIGREVARLLSEFKAVVFAYCRNPQSHQDCPYVTKIFGPSQLKEFLSELDYLVNILPHTKDTADLLSGK
jgi:phosphoglycerate dehydrogenase-like enzyme